MDLLSAAVDNGQTEEPQAEIEHSRREILSFTWKTQAMEAGGTSVNIA